MPRYILTLSPDKNAQAAQRAFNELAKSAAAPRANFNLDSVQKFLGTAIIETAQTDIEKIAAQFPDWAVVPEGRIKAKNLE